MLFHISPPSEVDVIATLCQNINEKNRISRYDATHLT